MDISRVTPAGVVLGVALSAGIGFMLGRPAAEVASAIPVSAPTPTSQPSTVGEFGGPTRCHMIWRVDLKDAPDGFAESVQAVADEVPELAGVIVSVTDMDAPDTVSGSTVVDVSWDVTAETAAESKAYAFAARPVNVPVVDSGRIVFTRSSLDLTAQGVRNVLRHEVGHILGLPHSDVPDAVSTMETSVYRLNVLESRGQSPWTQDTRDELAHMYGSACVRQ